MSYKRKILWESWNARVDEAISEDKKKNQFVVEDNESDPDQGMKFLDMADFSRQMVIFTPYGAFPVEHMLKPSDRWSCWILNTSFDITNGIIKQMSKIEGISAVKALDKYSVFIGIGKFFDISEVRSSIEEKLCGYSDEEILADNDISSSVNAVKQQIEDEKYWSIFVSPHGEIDYISSPNMDKSYLEGLNNLEVMKQNMGGIILRSMNG